MTGLELARDGVLRLLAGSGIPRLCVWEPGVVRSTQEARALAVHGCEHVTAAPSVAMRMFMGAYSSQLEGRLGPAPYELGRVCISGDGSHDGGWLRAARDLAHACALSYLEPGGVVTVHVRGDDFTAMSALLRLLEAGAASRANLTHECLQLSLRHTSVGFVAVVRDAAKAQALALRLLGFRHTRAGSWQRQIALTPFTSARTLTRVVHACCGVEAAADVTLTPPRSVTPLVRTDVPDSRLETSRS